MNSFTRGEILEQLDRAAAGFRFPMLDNGYYYPVDVRLHAYADADKWAIAIETLGYNPRAGNLLNVIEKYGNGLRPGADNDDFIGRIDNYAELWNLEQQDRSWLDAEGVVIRGRLIPFALVRSADAEPWTLLREIVPEHRDLFLASDEELRARIPPELPELLRLEQWNHPDLLKGEVPSETEAFRMIAEVMLARDPTLYAPSLPPNTTGATGRTAAPSNRWAKGRTFRNANRGVVVRRGTISLTHLSSVRVASSHAPNYTQSDFERSTP